MKLCFSICINPKTPSGAFGPHYPPIRYEVVNVLSQGGEENAATTSGATAAGKSTAVRNFIREKHAQSGKGWDGKQSVPYPTTKVFSSLFEVGEGTGSLKRELGKDFKLFSQTKDKDSVYDMFEKFSFLSLHDDV